MYQKIRVCAFQFYFNIFILWPCMRGKNFFPIVIFFTCTSYVSGFRIEMSDNWANWNRYRQYFFINLIQSDTSNQISIQCNATKTIEIYMFQQFTTLLLFKWNNNKKCMHRLLNKLILSTRKLLISHFYLTLSST